jgi:hypothetical protein
MRTPLWINCDTFDSFWPAMPLPQITQKKFYPQITQITQIYKDIKTFK